MSTDSFMNPTDDMRHSMIKESLQMLGRPEDYEYIVKLLSPPKEITTLAAPGEMKGLKIGIIGGGLAGMAAAYELRKMGADITILEALEDRIGGRVYTYYFDEPGKYYAEFGPMRVPVTHETTWHYINLLQLDTISASTPMPNAFRYVHNVRLRMTDSIEQYLYPLYDLTPEERSTPWTDITNYAFTYPMKQLPPEVRAEMLQILPEYSPQYLPFINTSVRQYVENLGLSQGAMNLMYDLNPILAALFPLSYDEEATENYSLDFLNIYRIRDGFVNLPLAFYHTFHESNPIQYNNLPKDKLGNVTYKPGHLVTGLYQYANRQQKVQVQYMNTYEAHESIEEFDYVICTIPFSALRTVEIRPLFTNQKMQAIYQLNYIDSQKSAFYCNQRFWEKNTYYGNINGGISITDLPIKFIVYPNDHIYDTRDKLQLAAEPGVLTASYNFGQDAVRLGNLEDWRRYGVIRSNVEEVHGLPRGYLDTIVEAFKMVHWNTEPHFRGAFAMSLPGQKNLYAYQMLQPEYNNHLFFAGEHLSTKHGWIQGALYTGKDAANKLLMSFQSRKSTQSE